MDPSPPIRNTGIRKNALRLSTPTSEWPIAGQGKLKTGSERTLNANAPPVNPSIALPLTIKTAIRCPQMLLRGRHTPASPLTAAKKTAIMIRLRHISKSEGLHSILTVHLLKFRRRQDSPQEAPLRPESALPSNLHARPAVEARF